MSLGVDVDLHGGSGSDNESVRDSTYDFESVLRGNVAAGEALLARSAQLEALGAAQTLRGQRACELVKSELIYFGELDSLLREVIVPTTDFAPTSGEDKGASIRSAAMRLLLCARQVLRCSTSLLTAMGSALDAAAVTHGPQHAWDMCAVGDVFIEQGDQLRLYNDYVSVADEVRHVFATAVAVYPELAVEWRGGSTRPTAHTSTPTATSTPCRDACGDASDLALALDGRILLPIQRLCRYGLLLRAIADSASSAADVPQLHRAVSAVEAAVAFCNLRKTFARVVEIEQRFALTQHRLAAPSRRVVVDDTRAYQRRYHGGYAPVSVFIFNDVLLAVRHSTPPVQPRVSGYAAAVASAPPRPTANGDCREAVLVPLDGVTVAFDATREPVPLPPERFVGDIVVVPVSVAFVSGRQRRLSRASVARDVTLCFGGRTPAAARETALAFVARLEAAVADHRGAIAAGTAVPYAPRGHAVGIHGAAAPLQQGRGVSPRPRTLSSSSLARARSPSPAPPAAPSHADGRAKSRSRSAGPAGAAAAAPRGRRASAGSHPCPAGTVGSTDCAGTAGSAGTRRDIVRPMPWLQPRAALPGAPAPSAAAGTPAAAAVSSDAVGDSLARGLGGAAASAPRSGHALGTQSPPLMAGAPGGAALARAAPVASAYSPPIPVHAPPTAPPAAPADHLAAPRAAPVGYAALVRGRDPLPSPPATAGLPGGAARPPSIISATPPPPTTVAPAAPTVADRGLATSGGAPPTVTSGGAPPTVTGQAPPTVTGQAPPTISRPLPIPPPTTDPAAPACPALLPSQAAPAYPPVPPAPRARSPLVHGAVAAHAPRARSPVTAASGARRARNSSPTPPAATGATTGAAQRSGGQAHGAAGAAHGALPPHLAHARAAARHSQPTEGAGGAAAQAVRTPPARHTSPAATPHAPVVAPVRAVTPTGAAARQFGDGVVAHAQLPQPQQPPTANYLPGPLPRY